MTTRRTGVCVTAGRAGICSVRFAGAANGRGGTALSALQKKRPIGEADLCLPVESLVEEENLLGEVATTSRGHRKAARVSFHYGRGYERRHVVW